MKFSLWKNDTSTYWDEVVLTIIIIAALAAGILLLIFHPGFWVVSESITGCFGIICILFAVMFIPSLIYRCLHNELDAGRKKNGGI